MPQIALGLRIGSRNIGSAIRKGRIKAAHGFYNLNGTSASFKYSKITVIGAGAYLLSGAVPASLLHKRKTVAGAGGYALTGTAATFNMNDVTAPVLSLPTDINSGSYGYGGSVTTNEANGTLYWVVSPSATPPTAAQIRAGKTNTDVLAPSNGNLTVTATGVQLVSGIGLSSSTTYYIHYVHVDSAGNESNIITGDGLTTPGAPDIVAPILSGVIDTVLSETTGSGSVTTDEGNGILYWVVTQSATPPSKTYVRNGMNEVGTVADDYANQSVSGTGSQTIFGGFSGLTASTIYYLHCMQEDAALNQSNVASGNGFTTNAPAGAFPNDGTGASEFLIIFA